MCVVMCVVYVCEVSVVCVLHLTRSYHISSYVIISNIIFISDIISSHPIIGHSIASSHPMSAISAICTVRTRNVTTQFSVISEYFIIPGESVSGDTNDALKNVVCGHIVN